MLDQVTRAVEPSLPLNAAVTEWNEFSEERADPIRLRSGQLESQLGLLENKSTNSFPISSLLAPLHELQQNP